MQNNDTAILLSKKISFDQGAPSVKEQALRIAVYDEYEALEAYKAIIEAYGANPPFVNLMQSEMRHYEELLILCEKHAVEPPINDITMNVPKTLRECYELGVAAEVENIQMYDSLLPYVKDYPDIEDAFFKFQAASYNNHLPTLREHLQQELETPNGSNGSFSQEDVMAKINEFSQMAQKIASGQADPNEISKMLSNVNTSLLTGVIVGGIGGFALNEFLKDKKEE